MFEKIKNNKISINIVQKIRDEILTGNLNPGDHLPSEKDLLAELGVSKHTLREALRALEVMGFLEIKKGAHGGAFVREVGLETARDAIINFLHFKDVSLSDLTQTRKIIEPMLTRQAVNKLSQAEIDKLAAMNEACRADLNQGESITGARHEIGFHRLLARVSGNPVLTLILDFVNGLLEEKKMELGPDLEFGWEVLRAHDRILDAIRKGDAELAESEMYRHLDEVEIALDKLKSPPVLNLVKASGH